MEDGGLEPIDDNPAINAAYEMNVVPMMCITNFTSTELGENLAHVVLGDLDVIERLLSNIISIMRQKGYLGLNIDFENVLPEDREITTALSSSPSTACTRKVISSPAPWRRR
jgi:spore germination protein